MRDKNYPSLVVWIVALIVIGGALGSLTQPEIDAWYTSLNRAFLTPPDYIFPIVWTILYIDIGICGWFIWSPFRTLSAIRLPRALYAAQLILNWSWVPLFFYYHLIGSSLIVLCIMDVLVCWLICAMRSEMRIVSILMIPYLLWILFATYLNFYIWQYN